MTLPSVADVVVAGGGPAGATIAHQLAGFGYRVVLIEKRRFPRHQIGESLTPSIFPLLDFLGVLTQVEQAGFLRMAGHSVCWGSPLPRTAYYSPDHRRRGFQSVRADFDLILLNHARQAGVRVVEGQPVWDVRPDGEDSVVVRYGSGDRLRAAFCVDATGHAGIYARQHLRQRDSVFQTLALTGYWQNAGNPPGVDFANTLLEAYADGMVWSVPLHTGERNVTLLLDWRHSRAIKRTGLQRFYIEEVRKAAYVSGFLVDARLPHPPQVFDASLYTARQFVVGRTLLVGDAGLFIDPLSSEGVRKAMASAITGAVVINTVLQRPAMRAHATTLYEAGQRDTYHSHYQQSARYYAEESRWPDHPFWQYRRSRLESDPAPTASQQPPSTAFSPFDSQPVSHLAVTPDLRIQEKPVIEGSYVELRPAVVTPRYPRGLRFLSGVNVPTLLRCVQTQCAVPDILDAYQRHPDGRQSPPAQIRQVLAQLYQEGLLRPTSPSESQSG